MSSTATSFGVNIRIFYSKSSSAATFFGVNLHLFLQCTREEGMHCICLKSFLNRAYAAI